MGMDRSINERITEIMIHFGFKSTKAFSEKVGIPYTTIKSMLAIGTNPGYDSLLKIITAFPDVSLKWLILGEDDMLFQQMVESGQNSDHDQHVENLSRLLNIIEAQQSSIHELSVANTKLMDELLKRGG